MDLVQKPQMSQEGRAWGPHQQAGLSHWLAIRNFCTITPNWDLLLRVANALQVLEAAGKHQVLIFVHSRKETAKTARFLKEEALKEDKLAIFMGGVSPYVAKTRSSRWVLFLITSGHITKP
jgi:hypothetical protein